MSSPVPRTTASLLIWAERRMDEDGEPIESVRWEASTDLPHWQLVGLLESARRAIDVWR